MDDDLARAVEALEAAGLLRGPVRLVRAKCPRCRRWCLRDPLALMYPCDSCTPVDNFGDLFNLRLAQEFGLSAKAFWAKVERDGLPATNPRGWIHPRAKWPKGGLRRPDQGGGVHSDWTQTQANAMSAMQTDDNEGEQN